MVRSIVLFVEVIYLTQHAEWVKVPFLQTIPRVICRTTNRIFVGVPLCARSFPGSYTPLTAFILIYFQAMTPTIRI